MKAKILKNVMVYIKSISNETELSQIAQYVDRQKELGHIIREPVSKFLQAGIHEIRPGPHRLLFCYCHGEIVLLHAFRKKSRVTPMSEIITAIKIKNRYLAGEGDQDGQGI